MTKRSLLRKAVLAGALATAVVGCGGGGGDVTTPVPTPPLPTPPVVASVSVALGSGALTVGQTAQATATLRTSAGLAITGRAISWSSSSPAVVTVSEAGVLTALSAGTSTIAATSEGIIGTASVTVTPQPVAAVTVELANSALTVGLTTQATATLRGVDNAVLAGRAITWSSSNTTVATVSQLGLVTALASGTATITAASEGKTAGASLTVSAVPVATIAFAADSIDLPTRGSSQLTVTLRDNAGAVLTGRAVTWSVSPSAIASITAAGLVRSLQPGTFTVTATSEGRSATMRVRGTVANLNAMLDSTRMANGLPAMGAAIVSTNGLVGIGAAGARRINGAIPVTVNDKWHLGSNTKALTGVLAGMAVQAGVLSWDRTILQAFPDLAGVMRDEYRTVTLTELFTHSSGVVNDVGPLVQTADVQGARLGWTSWTVQRPPQNARGTFYYSNNGYGITGAMIERAWGSSYEALMQDRIFSPLGLANVGWGPTTAAGASDQPIGHRRVGGAWSPCEACDNRPGLSAAGTLHMPLASWARIVQELLRADRGESTLLSQSTARYLTSNHLPAGSSNSYGIGWHVTGAANNRQVIHDGSNTTNHSRALLFLDSGVALLLTINAADLEPGGTGVVLTGMQQRLNEYWLTGR